MRHSVRVALLAGVLTPLGASAIAQEVQTGDQNSAQPRVSYQNMTPEQRAAATHSFLGLGPEPDRAAAARGEPLFQQACAFCHGPQARGATAPSLVTSDVVLSEDHGENLVPFLKRGLPEKGMPAFATISESDLRDIAEFIHLQVEEVANRGSYRVLNILVGDAAKGRTYVLSHCYSCHDSESFSHFGSKFRSPEQLQKGWIWPALAPVSGENAPVTTAVVNIKASHSIAGRVTQVSDFRITLVDNSGIMHAIERHSGVDVLIKDPLAAHQEMIMTMSNDDMHNVTAYLDSLK
jgi:mono/diheme cytochrome c family protein